MDGVIVQFPTEGKSFNTTLPELSAQVGCVIESILGGRVILYSTLISLDDGVHCPFEIVQVNT